MTKFCIICAARTGSTMLRHLLNSHPDLVCHGEIFLKEGVGSIDGKLRFDYDGDDQLRKTVNDIYHKDKKIFLARYVYGYDTSPLASGFKFKTDEYFLDDFKEVSSYLEEDMSIKIIHLKRKDLLAQYVSHLKVLRGGMVQSLNGQQQVSLIRKIKDLLFGKEIRLNTTQTKKYFDTVVKREIEIDERFNNHQVVTIYYEDIVSNADAINALLNFIGVSDKKLETPTQKIITDYKDLIKNLDQLSSELKNGKYANRVLIDV